ncbi:MAG: DUF7507 domain-containing protein [Planctomycetota bacterium]|jgi:hypothetical protein
MRNKSTNSTRRFVTLLCLSAIFFIVCQGQLCNPPGAGSIETSQSATETDASDNKDIASLGAVPIGVGLLESMDLELVQGGLTVWSFTNINTVGKIDGTQLITLGTAPNGTIVTLAVTVDKPNKPLEMDRLHCFRINGWNASGGYANLFNRGDDGPITIRLQNMQHSGTNAFNTVDPFHPHDYFGVFFATTFLYMLDHRDGFINLPGGERYSLSEPADHNIVWTSIQVPHRNWTAASYGFAKLPSGIKTGFEMSSIPDFGGSQIISPLTITPINPSPTPGNPNSYFFPPKSPLEPGFANEIGICLNMRSVALPTHPAIDIEKFTEGHDADVPTGPQIPVGNSVTWSYVVMNTGDVDLSNVTVTDDHGVLVSCPTTNLAVGQSMTCTASGTAVAGQYANVGTVTGTAPSGAQVTDSDPSHYFGQTVCNPNIDIEKATNGQDADNPTGPQIPVGHPVAWTYVVTNTGSVPLSNVAVTDDQGVAVSCPASSLAVGASMTCTANGTAVAGQYANTGTVTGTAPSGAQVTDSDPSHYFGQTVCNPNIDIEKATNGQDADLPTGPQIPVGDPVNWTYVVTNIGSYPLSNVTVTDDQGVAVSCPKTSLAVGASMTCTANGTAVAGQYANIGTATGTAPSGAQVTDNDPSHYFGQTVCNPNIDIEKATNGHDADLPKGPQIKIGDPVNWTYVVTNTGNVPLSNISVTDDQGVAVSCPASSLAVGASMTCTASGTAVAGQYANIGTATGTAPCEEQVTDSDPSHYHTSECIIMFSDVVIAGSLSTGAIYNTSDTNIDFIFPSATVGDPVHPIRFGNIIITYIAEDVSGIGQNAMVLSLLGALSGSGMIHFNEVVEDLENPGVILATHSVVLDKNSPMPYIGVLNFSQTSKRIKVKKVLFLAAPDTEEFDVASIELIEQNYCIPGPPPNPAIDIEKATNGHDADAAPGPQITIGDPVTWTYVVTNTGDVSLGFVSVVDDQGVAVSCPKANLSVGESMNCTASGTAVAGQYSNLGTVEGTAPDGTVVTDDDPSHYCGRQPPTNPDIHLEKATNGHDADAPPGPQITAGDPVTWTYVVSNIGDVPLHNVAVTDNQLGPVSCPKSTLAVGESMTCTAGGTAVAGQYSNLGTAEGTAPDGTVVTDDDPSHYHGLGTGDQGCSPGYWKNHTGSWPPTGYSPGQRVDSVFAQAAAYSGIGSATLLEALKFGGGPGVDGGARILLRAATAALLNASHPGVSYPLTAGGVISSVDAALASGDRDTMLTLASQLDSNNNLGCPLN